MSINDPKTTVRQPRYVQGNRELIKDPAVIEEFDRLAAFLLGSQTGLGQREVERDLEVGFDRLPTFEWLTSPMDYSGSQILMDTSRAAAYAATYTTMINLGMDAAHAETAANAAGVAAESQVAGDTEGVDAYAGSDRVGDVLAPTKTGDELLRPSPPPTFNDGSGQGALGDDPGDPSVFGGAPAPLILPFDVILTTVPEGEFQPNFVWQQLVPDTDTVPPIQSASCVYSVITSDEALPLLQVIGGTSDDEFGDFLTIAPAPGNFYLDPTSPAAGQSWDVDFGLGGLVYFYEDETPIPMVGIKILISDATNNGLPFRVTGVLTITFVG